MSEKYTEEEWEQSSIQLEMKKIDLAIDKWKKIFSGEYSLTVGVKKCSLCLKYFDIMNGKNCCPKCPLSKIGKNCLTNEHSAWSKYNDLIGIIRNGFSCESISNLSKKKKNKFKVLIKKMISDLEKAKKNVLY